MTCQKCFDEPCPVAKAAKNLLGTWARERRKEVWLDQPHPARTRWAKKMVDLIGKEKGEDPKDPSK